MKNLSKWRGIFLGVFIISICGCASQPSKESQPSLSPNQPNKVVTDARLYFKAVRIYLELINEPLSESDCHNDNVHVKTACEKLLESEALLKADRESDAVQAANESITASKELLPSSFITVDTVKGLFDKTLAIGEQIREQYKTTP